MGGAAPAGGQAVRSVGRGGLRGGGAPRRRTGRRGTGSGRRCDRLTAADRHGSGAAVAAEQEQAAERHEDDRPDERVEARQRRPRATEDHEDDPQPGLPADAATTGDPYRGDEQERQPETDLAQPGPRRDARAGDQLRCRERRDDRTDVQRRGPTVDRPRDKERETDGEDRDGACPLEPGHDSLEKEQCAEDDEKDPDPRRAASDGVVAPVPRPDVRAARVDDLTAPDRLPLVGHDALAAADDAPRVAAACPVSRPSTRAASSRNQWRRSTYGTAALAGGAGGRAHQPVGPAG